MNHKTKIALIGYGKMGQEIDALCRDSEVFDVVSKNIEAVAKLGVNLVVGTTGWYKDLEMVKKLVTKYKIGFLYSPNFSIGANIFFKMIDSASKLFAKFPDYDVYGLEIHHKAKLDSPSGTALKIAEKIKGL